MLAYTSLYISTTWIYPYIHVLIVLLNVLRAADEITPYQLFRHYTLYSGTTLKKLRHINKFYFLFF